MSNIYLKVTIEKNRCSQNFDFEISKNLLPGNFFVVLQFTQIPLNFKTFCCKLKTRGLGAILCVSFLLF